MLTDAEVRAELERIDNPEQTLPWLFKITHEVQHQKGKNPTAITFATMKALRLLAESQFALGRIKTLIEARDNEDSCIHAIKLIAKNACKEE